MGLKGGSGGGSGEAQREDRRVKPARQMRMRKCNYRPYGGAAGKLPWPKENVDWTSFGRETDSPSASRWMTHLWEEAVLFMCEMELSKE